MGIWVVLSLFFFFMAVLYQNQFSVLQVEAKTVRESASVFCLTKTSTGL
jgi:hypothetical protein